VAARRYAVSGTTPSLIGAVARPTVPTIRLPFKITVKGALSRVRAPHGRPLSSDLER